MTFYIVKMLRLGRVGGCLRKRVSGEGDGPSTKRNKPVTSRKPLPKYLMDNRYVACLDKRHGVAYEDSLRF